MSATSLLALDNEVRTDLSQLTTGSWSEIEPLASKHRYWMNRRSDLPDDISKRRAVLATVFINPEAELRKLANGPRWISLRRRVTALLDAADSVGCFFLRRGTIEDYYLHVATADDAGKPEAAAAEVASWLASDKISVVLRYSDVVRAMRYAAPAQKVDENDLLREKLGAALGALFQSMQLDMSDDELNSRAQTTLGADASIFQFANVSNGQIKRLRVTMSSPLFKRDSLPFEISEVDNLTAAIREKLPTG
jgi:hypothetical protein